MTAIPGNVLLETAKTVALPTFNENVAKFRSRLLTEAGLNVGPPAHFKRPQERSFAVNERGRVTVLFGGLTFCHEQLIYAALEGLGYKVGLVSTPCKADFQAGKEYGNNGQCNPTYFTVGSLVNHLKRLRDEEGMETQRILDDYVFFTAGACGPCRFGMYEAEYRLALRNSGFDGFRVILLQQGSGLNQEDLETGLQLDLRFILSLLNAMFIGDLLGEVSYHIRPYEVEPGVCDRVFARCNALCQEKLRSKGDADSLRGGLAGLFARALKSKKTDDMAKFLDQLRGTHYIDALTECARIINEEIEVDYTRPKPIVKITGEFWAQTTEGDGNYKMFAFLESEGAEVLVEPVATWIAYMLNQVRNKAKDRRGLSEGDTLPDWWQLGRRWSREKKYRSSMLKFRVAEKLLFREYERMRCALGKTAHELANQQELVRLGHPYYNSRSGGGEGHLEVAKNIYYYNKDLAHMVLSLKPFGCMPSAQSDGAQAAVISNYSDMIYLPVETSGEGDINAHSRAQMALGEAKLKCKDEFKRAVSATGYTLDQIREYVGEHRELRRPLQRIPHVKGFVGRAANFVIHVGRLMDKDRSRRRRSQVEAGHTDGVSG